MKRILAVLICLVPIVALAQTVPIQQSAQRLDASAVAFAQAAVGSASTATITVPPGMFAYVTGVSVDACEGSGLTGVAAGSITSTGLSTNPSWGFSLVSTADVCVAGGAVRDLPSTPYKSQYGTNVTVVSPATSGAQYTIRVYYYLNQT
jgi:hypothetical protein